MKLDSQPPSTDRLRTTHDEIDAHAKALPYLAVISSEQALVMSDNPFTDFPGLRAVQRVRHPSAGDSLITYWSSEDHFEMNRAALYDRLGAPVTIAGGLGALATPAKPWWKRYTGLQIILTMSGIAGALQVLHSGYEKVATSPELSVTLEQSDGLYAIEGEPFTAKVTLQNFLSSVNHRQIKVKATLRPASGPAIPLEVSESRLAGLGAGKSHTIKIVGEVRSRGMYELEVEASAKAGLFSDSAPFKATTPLRVWAAEPEPFPLRVASLPTMAIVFTNVEVGRDAPARVVCSAIFKTTRPGGLINKGWFLAKPETNEIERHGTEVLVVKWTWAKLSGRTTARAEWGFDGVPLEELKELARTAQTRCIEKEL